MLTFSSHWNRFRLQLQISDKYGVVDVTAFSEAASDLLDVNFETMDALSEKTDTGEEAIHAQMVKIIGKEFSSGSRLGITISGILKSTHRLLRVQCCPTFQQKSTANSSCR